MLAPQGIIEGVNYVRGVVRGGKHPVAPLRLEFQTLALKKFHGFFRRELGPMALYRNFALRGMF